MCPFSSSSNKLAEFSTSNPSEIAIIESLSILCSSQLSLDLISANATGSLSVISFSGFISSSCSSFRSSKQFTFAKGPRLAHFEQFLIFAGHDYK